MKTLYLLRHAKAEAGGKDLSDLERTLAPRGREACQAMGEYMKNKRYFPGFVLCSPSARTRETLERVMQAAGLSPQCRFDNLLYLASLEEIMHQLSEVDDSVSSVLVVGHNPGMHHASLTLAESKQTKLRTELELKFPTCALATLRFDITHWDDISPRQGRLLDFVTPEEL